MTEENNILWIMFLSSSIGTCLTYLVCHFCAIMPILKMAQRLNTEKKDLQTQCGALDGAVDSLIDYILKDDEFDPGVHELRAMLIPEAEGGFSILSTNFPSAVSCGDTREECIANLKESFYGVVECLKEDGKPIVWEQDYAIDDDVVTPGSIEVRVLVNV